MAESPLAAGSPSAKGFPPEDLPEVGSKPFNEYLITPLSDALAGEIPPGGFAGKMGRKEPVGMLREALATRLDVPKEGVSLVHEGRDLNDDKTIAENGIVEPGPAAKKKGAKIGVMFMLSAGVELGHVRRRREQEERDEQERLEAERAEKDRIMRENAERQQREAEEKAKAAAEAEEKARLEQAAVADRCVLRCKPLDADGTDDPVEIHTLLSRQVREVALQIQTQVGMAGTGHLVLVCNGNDLAAGATLRDAGVATGAEVLYFWQSH
mmetsp:Transcript_148060/g.258265  ORF Transcript_148060/g.258265 Transcript_148060/m.258265 type:complete len:268 (+) Transcript_148060:100-903(+)